MLFVSVTFVIGLLFVAAIVGGEGAIVRVFDVRQHEWYRELSRDWVTSQQQFWRDWRLLKRFAHVNAPWLYASASGLVGLTLTVILVIANMPESTRANVAGMFEPTTLAAADHDLTTTGAIDTRAFVADLGPQVDSTIMLTSGLAYQAANASDPVNESPMPAVPPVVQRQPPKIDLEQAFRDFPLKPEPDFPRAAPMPHPLFDDTAEAEPEPTLELELDRDYLVTAVPVQVDELVARLPRDDWEPAVERSRAAPRPILYSERHNIRLSVHERTGAEAADSIRIRPAAIGRQAVAALDVARDFPKDAVAGTEVTYQIVVSNPGDVLPKAIVEESMPEGWSLIDATPVGELLDARTLQWTIENLGRGESQSFRIRVLAGGAETGASKTVVTVGAAVESTVTFSESSEAEPEQVPSAGRLSVPPEIKDSWRAAGSGAKQQRSPDKPQLPDRPAESIDSELRMEVELPSTARVGGDVRFRFIVTNSGSVPVEDAGVVLWLSKKLMHQQGRRIRYSIGHLDPGETRRCLVDVKAVAAGRAVSGVELRSGDQLHERGEPALTVK